MPACPEEQRHFRQVLADGDRLDERAHAEFRFVRGQRERLSRRGLVRLVGERFQIAPWIPLGSRRVGGIKSRISRWMS